MANPEQLEELESLEAIYADSSEVVIRRSNAQDDVDDLDSKADLEVNIFYRTAAKSSCLILRLWLPMEYLSESEIGPVAPKFELESSAFSEGRLSSFCGELDRLFGEQAEYPILFSWIEWLRTEAPEMTQASPTADQRALKLWVAEPEEEKKILKPEDLTCSICLDNTLCQMLESCQHLVCAPCTAACMQVESANKAQHCCPLPSCREPLCEQDILRCGEKPPEAWMHIVRQILGSRFQDAVVFCPRCEDRGMDIPVLLGHGQKSEHMSSEIDAEAINCRCFSCETRFCGICRSPPHPGSACFDDKLRIVRLAKRRPPLASELQDMAVRIAQDMTKAEFDRLKDFASASVGKGFDQLQRLFLSWHETSILEALDSVFGSDVRVYEAPVSRMVKERFMKAYELFPDTELRPAFHGSDARNYPLIFANGLLIPGDGNSVRMAHGAAHGRGVYTANLNAAWLSKGFCSDPIMLVCGVLQTSVVRHVFDAMVVGDSSHIVPLLVCEARPSAPHRLPLPPPVSVKPVVTAISQKVKAPIANTSSEKKATKFKAKLAKHSQRH